MGKSQAVVKVDRASMIPTALAEQEYIIERGMHSFIELGMALKKIRVGKLYTDEFSTFEDYCRERWGWTRQHSNRLIAGAEVATKLEPMGSKIQITERLIRPIVDLEWNQQKKVFEEAVKTAPDGKLTAKHVAKVKAEIIGGKTQTPKSTTQAADSIPNLWIDISNFLMAKMSTWPHAERHQLAENLRNFANIVDDARRETMA